MDCEGPWVSGPTTVLGPGGPLMCPGHTGSWLWKLFNLGGKAYAIPLILQNRTNWKLVSTAHCSSAACCGYAFIFAGEGPRTAPSGCCEPELCGAPAGSLSAGPAATFLSWRGSHRLCPARLAGPQASQPGSGHPRGRVARAHCALGRGPLRGPVIGTGEPALVLVRTPSWVLLPHSWPANLLKTASRTPTS